MKKDKDKLMRALNASIELNEKQRQIVALQAKLSTALAFELFREHGVTEQVVVDTIWESLTRPETRQKFYTDLKSKGADRDVTYPFSSSTSWRTGCRRQRKTGVRNFEVQ